MPSRRGAFEYKPSDVEGEPQTLEAVGEPEKFEHSKSTEDDASGEALQICFDVRCNSSLVPSFYFLLGGCLATPSLAQKYFAIRVLGINPGSFGALIGLVSLPWSFKPVYGLISDTNPLLGRHRSPYIAINAFLLVLCWFLAGIPGPHSRTVLGFGTLMILSQVVLCFCDVMVDCMIARASREEIAEGHRGRSQSLAWLCRGAGTLFGVTLGGWLVVHVENLHFTFAVTTLYALAILVGSLFLRERRSQMEPQTTMWRHLRRTALGIYEDRDLLHLAVFYFLFSASPNSGNTFSYYLINELKFSESFMASLSVAAVVAGMAAIVFQQAVLKPYNIRTVMRIVVAVSTLLSLAPLLLVTRANRALGIEDAFFALGDDLVEAFVGQLAIVPLQATVAARCPPGKEGLMYAGFMSISNFGGVLSMWLGAALTHTLGITKDSYRNMWLLLVLCALSNFVPFFYTRYLPGEKEEKK